MKGKLLYEESQGYLGTWIWYLTLLSSLMMIVLFSTGLYTQLVLGEEWGDKPMSDLGLILTSTFTMILMIGITIFVSIQKLTLKIDEGSIYVSFRPYFGTKAFRMDEFQQIHVRKYQPIMEYGGWGLRLGFGKNKAYSISGKWGLQLVFQDGRKLLIGTKEPDRLKAVIIKISKDHG